MALVMTPIYTQTVGAGGASLVTFNNIPQFYTDLMVVVSARTVGSGSASGRLRLSFNNDASSIYSTTFLGGTGGGTSVFRETGSSNIIIGPVPQSVATANTFGNSSAYVPNYTASNFKQVIGDGVSENNAATISFDGQNLTAGLYRSTSAITALGFVPEGGNFAQHSTFSLYGIIRSGA